MLCQACRAEVTDDARFCPQCGKPLTSRENDTLPNPFTTPAQQLEPNRQGSSSSIEQKLWQGGYSGKAMVGNYFAAGMLNVGLCVAGFFVPIPGALWMAVVLVLLIVCGLTLVLAYRKLNVNYELTTHRFIHRSGIVRRVTDRIEAIDMDDVAYEQGIIERFMDVGTIRISSSDTSHPELVLYGISDVERIAQLIDQTRHLERLRRGLHIESV